MEPNDLYGLPLDRFIPERDALAKSLRADKKRDEAAAVTALRKPTVAAWAVNQLVRTQGRAVKELFDAGDALRDAQAGLLAGRGDGAALQAANARHRSAHQALVDSARGLLTSDGHELSGTVIERVSETLRAAALDEEARAQVQDGRLERELRHAGLGLGESPFAPVPAKRAAKKAKAPKKQDAKQRAAAEQVERERAAALKAAQTAETSARRVADRSARVLRSAEERLDRATQALDAAEEGLDRARAAADAAAEGHRRAQAALEKLR